MNEIYTEKPSARKEKLNLSKQESMMIFQALAEVHNLYVEMEKHEETVRNYSLEEMKYAIMNLRVVYEKWKHVIDFHNDFFVTIESKSVNEETT